MDNIEKEEVRAPFKKPLGVLIKFKSMSDILLNTNAYFDGHGNLTNNDMFGQRSHLAPTYFSYLGKTRKFEHECSFPHWVIEAEYWDIFEPNMALRIIASGKADKERCVEIAQKALVIP